MCVGLCVRECECVYVKAQVKPQYKYSLCFRPGNEADVPSWLNLF